MGKCVVHPIADHGTPSALVAHKAEFAQHLSDAVRHITAVERSKWNQQPYVCGVYTGNGAAEQRINLGFQPVLVATWSQSGQQVASNTNLHFGGVALPGFPSSVATTAVLVVTANGFTVYLDSRSGVAANSNGAKYYYIAFRP